MPPNGDAAQIEEAVRAYLAAYLELPIDAIRPTARLREDLGAESADLVALLIELEEAYELAISDEEASELTTVEAVVRFVSAASSAHQNE